MSLENLPGTDDQFAALRAALSGGDAARTPEIVAIFQQIKNLRESDRSLRSIRRNLELDNMPVLEPNADSLEEGDVATNELSVLLDSFLKLKGEKESLSDRLVQMVSATDQLEAKVNQLTALVERQAEQLAKMQP
ncbi:MAG: hypothetical protein ACK46X_15625 [Candidatus Sericytochromatia bacterium]